MTTENQNTQSNPATQALSDPAGSLLLDTQAEIQQLEATGDPIFHEAAKELREAANYSFPDNTESRNLEATKADL